MSVCVDESQYPPPARPAAARDGGGGAPGPRDGCSGEDVATLDVSETAADVSGRGGGARDGGGGGIARIGGAESSRDATTEERAASSASGGSGTADWRDGGGADCGGPWCIGPSGRRGGRGGTRRPSILVPIPMAGRMNGGFTRLLGRFATRIVQPGLSFHGSNDAHVR